MAGAIFARIAGIKGESVDAKHKDEIDVLSWSWGVSQIGSMAHGGGVAILGLPTCGAYSKATAADLLLPRLLSGEKPSEATVAKLGHGGILTRSQRFRFPAYARELDAPDG